MLLVRAFAVEGIVSGHKTSTPVSCAEASIHPSRLILRRYPMATTMGRLPAAALRALLAASAFACAASAPAGAADPDGAVDRIPTASPIKHVIIIVGENRSFDHLFATYVP